MPRTGEPVAHRAPDETEQETFVFNRAWTILTLAVLSWVVVFGFLKLIGIV